MPPTRAGFLALTCVLSLAACAAGGKGAVRASGPVPLDDVSAAEHIGAATSFAEPIRVEVPSVGRGPTIDALAATGLIALGPDRRRPFTVTPAGQAAGFTSTEFQIGLPVYKIPIGERRLISVEQIEIGPSGHDAFASFTYRNGPTKLGTELIQHGARIEGFDDPTPRAGRAILTDTETGWKVFSVQL